MKIVQFRKWCENHTDEEIARALAISEIYEVINCHKMKVRVSSRDKIKIYKANGRPVNEIDLTLNSFWNDVIRDWELAMMKAPEVFSSHIGMSLEMQLIEGRDKFQLLEKRDADRGYVILSCCMPGDETLHTLEEHDKRIHEVEIIMKKVAEVVTANTEAVCIELPTLYNDVVFHHTKFKVFDGDQDHEEASIYIDSSMLIAKPEEVSGFIVHLPENSIWCKVMFKQQSNIKVSTVALEFLYADILKWLVADRMKNIERCIKPNDYIQTVCNIFESYIIETKELVTHKLEKNISASDIVAPGTVQSKVCIDFIKSLKTKILCQESDLYNNIFKVLLVNLQRHKSIEWCSYMNECQVERWNKVVDLISRYTKLKIS